MNWIRNKWSLKTSAVLLFVVMTMLDSCSQGNEKRSRVNELPFYNDATFMPRWLKSEDVPSNFHQIPAFNLIDQKGSKITEKQLDNKITVVDFFFTTCPGICPKMTSNMLIVQEEFISDKNFQIFSHTVTPEYDDVTVLSHYAEAKGVESEQWHLLTGDRSMIYDLGRNFYFIEEDLGLQKDQEDFIHTENFVLIDQNRRIRGIYNGLSKTAIKQLIVDAKTLIKS